METKKYWLYGGEIRTLSTVIIACVALAFALNYTRHILIPFVLSIFLYFILSPIQIFLVRKLKFPRSLALLSTFIVVFLVLSLIFLLMSSAIQEFGANYHLYQAKAIYLVDQLQDSLNRLGLPLEDADMSEAIRKLPLVDVLKGAGSSVLGLISTTGLVFIFLIFLFTGSGKAMKPLPKSEVGGEINKQIRKYLATKLLMSAVTGILVFIILSAFQLDLAFVFSFLVFVLNFIPTIGSLAATILPLPVAYLQYDSELMTLMVILIPGLVQFFVGGILEPRMMGRSLNLHPVTVMLSLMFWGLIWGVVGAFLAVPILAIIKIVLEKIEGGKIIAQWMEGHLKEPSLN